MPDPKRREPPSKPKPRQRGDNQPKRVTAHAEKLLTAIERQRNQWLTRAQVATSVGKKRLTPYDIALLDLLAEEGLIRRQQEEGFSREGYRWVYGVFDVE